MVKWALLVALAIVGACTLFDEELPGESCTTDTDCFRAQGEICNQQTKTCEMRPDAAIVPIDAPVDAEVDAQ
jgi:hypothetical protein